MPFALDQLGRGQFVQYPGHGGDIELVDGRKVGDEDPRCGLGRHEHEAHGGGEFDRPELRVGQFDE